MDLFSGTLKRPKLRPNRTVTEVDRDRTETETETWTEWCAKNRTGPGPPNPLCERKVPRGKGRSSRREERSESWRKDSLEAIATVWTHNRHCCRSASSAQRSHRLPSDAAVQPAKPPPAAIAAPPLVPQEHPTC